MDDPVLFVIDADEAAREHLGRELADRYATHYELVAVSSAAEASARLTALAADGVEVALVLAGGWQPGEGGCHVLEEVAHLHPHAQ